MPQPVCLETRVKLNQGGSPVKMTVGATGGYRMTINARDAPMQVFALNVE